MESMKISARIIMNYEKSIRELETKIGAFYYQKFSAGEAVDDAVLEYCTAISVHKANIEEKKAALNSGKEKTDHIEDPFEQM